MDGGVMDKIQNNYLQVVITKGKIIENEDGTTSKVIDEIVKDNVECFEVESDLLKRIEELNGL